MKITGLEAWSATMRLSEPYTIAYESIEAATNIFLRVKTNGGIVGYGCAAPDLEVTGETPDSASDTSTMPFVRRWLDPIRCAFGSRWRR